MNRKEKTIVVTIGANLILVGLKYALAAFSGSLALRASAWHSLADVLISLFVLLGLLISRWESGRRRGQVSIIENLVALVVAGFIFYVAYDIFQETLLSRETPDLRNLWPVTVGSLLTVVITYFTARYKEYVGRVTQSPSLIAGGYHSRIDLYASVFVVVSLVAAALGLGAVDRLAAVVVILFILLAGWEIAGSAVNALLQGGVLQLEEEDLAHMRVHTRRLLRYGMGLLVSFTLLSGIYLIQPDERGVIRRFGRFVSEVGPGLHYRLPLIERLDRVAISAVRQVQTGTTLALTGDTNLIEVGLSVHYTVNDAVAFLFNVNQREQLVRQSAEAALRQVVAARSVDALLTTARSMILAETLTRTQVLLDQQLAGIRVATVQLQTVTPPSAVAEAFRDVASAREDKNTYIQEALAYQNEIVPAARGEAVRLAATASAEKQKRVDLAVGESARFTQKLAAYRTAPAVTRNRLYLEALEKVLPKVNKFILDPSIQTDTTDLWFDNSQPAGQVSGQ
ncbi:MAG: FtsH protease activity modulator HflK [Caldilineaceae bacterium]|nr:FtsH protease activity modulator HflK [Caldilineaceae bacterium]